MPHLLPRHRAAHLRRPARRRPSPRSIALSAVSGVLLTGGAVSGEAVVDGSADRTAASLDSSTSGELPLASDRFGDVSRGSGRTPLAAADLLEEAARDEAARDDKARKKARAAAEQRRALEAARDDPRGVARDLLADRGLDASQFSCLDALWAGESGWDYRATNPSSGAYGIPQSLPASKMATAGDDWETNPTTQITWGLDYIEAAYGSPCAAQSFKSGSGFY